MDAFQLLKADHEKVAQLFDQLESAKGSAKLQIFQQIRTELELHTHIEETIFYPAVEKPEETHDLTLEAYEEHNVVKSLLRELSRSRTANDEWEAQAKVLRENVEHHVEEEENELFPKAEDALGEDAIETLGDRMAAEKQRKQGQASKSARASKARTSKKAAGTKKSAGTAKKAAGGSKKGRGTKKAAKKASKKTGGTKRSASKSATRSTAAKTTRRSRSKKSAAKKR